MLFRSLEEAALITIVLWVLPWFGINIPPWGIVVMATGLGTYSYLTGRLSKKALDKKPVVSPDIGSKSKTVTSLTPDGYVRVSNELWKASSIDSTVRANKEVAVVGIDGMTVQIAPRERILHSHHGN